MNIILYEIKNIATEEYGNKLVVNNRIMYSIGSNITGKGACFYTLIIL